MALKSIHSILIVIFIAFLFAVPGPVDSVHALDTYPHPGNPPLLDTFASEVSNGQAGELRAIYIPGNLAGHVVQQPTGVPEFVSPRDNIVTQFDLASQFGSVGLLAHNDLAGAGFSSLEKNQVFYLIYGDGQISAFIITEILSYQALEHDSPLSQFVSLDNGELLTTSEVFLEVYNRPGDVILQTCIARENNLSWGRLFVIAEPYFPSP